MRQAVFKMFCTAERTTECRVVKSRALKETDYERKKDIQLHIIHAWNTHTYIHTLVHTYI